MAVSYAAHSGRGERGNGDRLSIFVRSSDNWVVNENF